MKEKAVSEIALKQAHKVIDAIEGKATIENVCSEFTYCAEVDVRDFKNRMV